MLRTIRLTLAIVFFAIITLLFLDFSGTLHGYMGWMAKIQFLPALLALNVGVVLLLVVLTLLFGRVYCSVICPLGVFQDVLSRFAGKRKKNRFRYSPARKWLRYGMLALFFVTLVAGVRFHAVASLLEPYSSYGRIASNLFAPVYQWGNNLLAYLAERADSYAFYETEVWMKSLSTFIIAADTFLYNRLLHHIQAQTTDIIHPISQGCGKEGGPLQPFQTPLLHGQRLPATRLRLGNLVKTYQMFQHNTF